VKKFSGNRLVFLGAAVAATVAVAAACVLVVVAGDTSSDGRISISFQTPFARGTREFRQIEEVADLFRQENPDIWVRVLSDGPREREAIIKRILAGHAPDILEMPLAVLPPLAAGGHIAELGDTFCESLGNVFSSALAAGKYEGSTYAAPFRASSTQLVYNGAVLLKAGYPPNDPLLGNWAELLETCRVVERSASLQGCSPLGIDGGEPGALANLAAMLVEQTEGELLALEEHQRLRGLGPIWRVAVNNDAGVHALTMLEKLGKYMPRQALNWSREDLLREFVAGHVAMFFGDVRAVSRITLADPGIELRVVEAPIDRARVSRVEFYGAAMTKAARHRDACKRLLAYLCGSEAQKVIMTGGSGGPPTFAPVREDLLSDSWYYDHPHYRPFLEALKYPSGHTRAQGWAEVRKQAFAPELRKLLTGRVGPRTAAENIEKRGNTVLSTYYGHIGHASETTVLGMSIIAIGVFLLVFFTVGHRAKH